MTIGRQSDFMTNANPPKQNVLERLHKKSISAKDIAQQFWCEKQMELSYMYGFQTNKAMAKGSAIHQQMQVEVYKELAVEPVTWADKMYRTAYENIMTLNTLVEKGVARELKIYGSVNGYLVVGQIDEMRMSQGKVVIVENKTTRSDKINPQYTKPHLVQVMLYRRLLEDLRNEAYQYQNLNAHYKLSDMRISEKFAEGLRGIGIKDEMLSVGAIYTKMFDAISAMPELSDSLIIHYVNSDTKADVCDVNVNYRSDELNGDLIYAMKYWNGERDANPVPEAEKWKCKFCGFFGNRCTVWYQK